ncbi:MAG: hypothetical protein K2Q24_07975 [Chitinophagaceae bacterium]|jgi:hypothetical protein|nr:hypothetical protein [Chitinophagaceae bacterium]
MYEHKRQPLASTRTFYKRIGRSLLFAIAVLLVSLLIGIIGYHATTGMSWLDALLNASMILSGMGPVDTITTDEGKWFASFYALFSGVIFITNIGLILAPAIHRIMHRLHVEDEK